MGIEKKIANLIPKPVKLAIKPFLERKSLYLSQAGQDFWVYGETFNEMRNGYFLDIGAHDGISFSNTYILEYKYAWNGICVEANPDIFKQLKKNRRALCVNACLDSAEGLVDFAKGNMEGGIISPNTDNKAPESHEVVQMKTQTLESLWIGKNVPHEIDYISIDIEGAEERVLGSFNFKEYRFKCITVERPSDTLRKILVENEYVLVKEIPEIDCFYVHRSFIPQYITNLSAFYFKRHLTIRWR